MGWQDNYISTTSATIQMEYNEDGADNGQSDESYCSGGTMSGNSPFFTGNNFNYYNIIGLTPGLTYTVHAATEFQGEIGSHSFTTTQLPATFTATNQTLTLPGVTYDVGTCNGGQTLASVTKTSGPAYHMQGSVFYPDGYSGTYVLLLTANSYGSYAGGTKTITIVVNKGTQEVSYTGQTSCTYNSSITLSAVVTTGDGSISFAKSAGSCTVVGSTYTATSGTIAGSVAITAGATNTYAERAIYQTIPNTKANDSLSSHTGGTAVYPSAPSGTYTLASAGARDGTVTVTGTGASKPSGGHWAWGASNDNVGSGSITIVGSAADENWSAFTAAPFTASITQAPAQTITATSPRTVERTQSITIDGAITGGFSVAYTKVVGSGTQSGATYTAGSSADSTVRVSVSQATVNSNYATAASVTVYITVTDSRPAAPANFSVTYDIVTSAFNFSWTPNGATSYHIRKVTGPYDISIDTGAVGSTSTGAGQLRNTAFTFSIYATNSYGDGPVSTSGSVIIPYRTDTVYSISNGDSYSVTYLGTPLVKSFSSDSGRTPTFSITGFSSITATSFTFTPSAATTYSNIVATWGNDGTWATITRTFTIVSAALVLSTPTLTHTSTGALSQTFTWNSVADATAYEWFFAGISSGEILSGSALSVPITTMANNTAYTFSVYAKNASVTSSLASQDVLTDYAANGNVTAIHLAAARDNTTSITVKGARAGARSMSGYRIDDVYISAPSGYNVGAGLNRALILNLRGGGYINELADSFRTNVTWSTTAGATVSATSNYACTFRSATPGVYIVTASWSDSYNPVRSSYYAIKVN
jgi:hypothetical protein